MLFYLARQAARLDEIDLANEFLSRSIDAGYWITASLRADPWLNPVRKTIRFRELLTIAEDREAQSRRALVSAGGVEILAMDFECMPNRSGEAG
jgi:hypothetical protein